MLRALVRECARVSPRRRTRARSRRRRLASLWSQLSGPPAEIESQPHAAVRLARELAGEDGAVVATGSIYLVADLLAAPGTRRRSAL
jgi:dihydrofolate synthase/folylpolyglutamate synthase